MEILSSINYGRCFNYNILHPNCGLCCFECKTKCDKQCRHSTYLKAVNLCGNYEDIVDRHNLRIVQQKVISEKYKR